MQRIRREQAMQYEFAKGEPLITVEQGESFQIETEDAGSGLITSVEMADRIPHLPTRRSTPTKSNPVGGPVAVSGAEPGDLLEVEIESINLSDTGYTNWGPNRTKIGDDFRWPDLNRWTVRIFDHHDGNAYLNGERLWPTRPMIGCISVAPERESINTSDGQTISGGNLDARDITVGTRVQFNVFHSGALLFLGDVHASQADTEYYGTADETRALVQARCSVIKSKRIPFIRLLKSDSIVALRTGASLDVLVDQAVQDLMHWLVEDYNLTPERAYLHTCINPDFRINVYQFTLGLATVGAEIPTRYLQA